MKLSLCLIVKNEEEYLERCLGSLYEHVDEIIITDTGSTDQTLEIAKKYTDKIYHFRWIDDFSAARNFCQSHATGDYILWMDGDEWFLKQDILALKNGILYHPLGSIFSINIIHVEKSGKPLKKEEKIKVIKNNQQYVWKWKIHEIIDTVHPQEKRGLEIYLNEVNYYHSRDDNNKTWTDIHYFETYFPKEPENNTVALFLLYYYLEKKELKSIEGTLSLIPYIHWKFWGFYTLYSKKLGELGYTYEKKHLDTLIKKSILSYKKLKKIH